MGNVFRRFGLVSLGVLFLAAACSDAATEDENNSGPLPFQGLGNSLPNPPAMTPEPNTTPEPSDSPSPSPAPTTNTEAPPLDAPVAPPQQEPEQAPATPPPTMTPPETPPPSMTPPEPPPPQTPPPQQPEPEPPPPAGPQTRVFLLFGQSNMWGVPLPQQQDLAINPRVEVLTTTQCNRHGNNQWVPAQPPLHGCVGAPGTNGQGPGVGPGDYFAKAIAEAFPQDTILLVPAAVPGVSIDTFQPGAQNYNNLLNRARMARARGEIAGMLFHQGETDSGQQNWPMRVKNTVDRLRADLQIGDVPFVAGELFRGAYQGHNNLVNQLPNIITNASVATAEGFGALPRSVDGFGNLHFDLAAQREYGRRYAAEMLELLGE